MTKPGEFVWKGPGGLDVMFSDNVSAGKILHNDKEGKVYMSTADEYRFHLEAFGLEKGVEECMRIAQRRVEKMIDQRVIAYEFKMQLLNHTPLAINTQKHGFDYIPMRTGPISDREIAMRMRLGYGYD